MILRIFHSRFHSPLPFRGLLNNRIELCRLMKSTTLGLSKVLLKCALSDKAEQALGVSELLTLATLRD